MSMGAMYNTTTAQFTQNLMVEMRAAPSITTSNFGVSTLGGTISTTSAVSVSSATAQFVRVSATLASHSFSANTHVFARVPSNVSGYITFDAEL